MTMNGARNGHTIDIPVLPSQLPVATAWAEPPPGHVGAAASWVDMTRGLLLTIEHEIEEKEVALRAEQERLEQLRKMAGPLRDALSLVDHDVIRALEQRSTAYAKRVQPTAAAVAPSHDSQPTSGRWSREHACCRACKKTDSPHAGKGLCRRCYGHVRAGTANSLQVAP